MQKVYWLVGIVAVIIALVLVFQGDKAYTEAVTFSQDTTVESYEVKKGQSVVVENNATLTVEGDLTVNGSFECRGGDLNVVVLGDLNLEDRIYCQDEDGGSTSNIFIVVKGNLNTSTNSEIISNGSIQIVENESLLLTTQTEIDTVYDETEIDEGEGQRIGPLVDDDSISGTAGVSSPQSLSRLDLNGLTSILPGQVAHAQGVPGLRGRMVVNTPPKGVKQIVLFLFPSGTINVIDFTLDGPDGRKGNNDKGGGCNAKGGDGENAFRFNAQAPNIKVGTFTLNLGDGGAGGDAETTKNCDPGTAKGGKGGKSGNFRMVAGSKFEITGSFVVNPGKGGQGGEAIAHGKDGGPSEDGGDATATGGSGADNKKRLSVVGNVAGSDKVEVGDIMGGNGGNATANPGNGGDADACGKKGGNGGDGKATGGKGGDASVILGGGTTRSAGATDIGGNGGDSNSHGGKGGVGGSCDHTAKGGDGGKGGNASTDEGKKGSAEQDGTDGTKTDETAGDGGNGGDGCTEGKGGDGGSGEPDGQPGKDGKNLCQSPPSQNQTSIDQPEPDTNRIQVIQYMDYYIPVDQLRVAPGHEPFCEQDHWHANGPIVNTMGFPMEDPQPDGCGFGHVNQVPVMEIEI